MSAIGVTNAGIGDLRGFVVFIYMMLPDKVLVIFVFRRSIIGGY
jgi:hypothetical protein